MKYFYQSQRAHELLTQQFFEWEILFEPILCTYKQTSEIRIVLIDRRLLLKLR